MELGVGRLGGPKGGVLLAPVAWRAPAPGSQVAICDVPYQQWGAPAQEDRDTTGQRRRTHSCCNRCAGSEPRRTRHWVVTVVPAHLPACDCMLCISSLHLGSSTFYKRARRQQVVSKKPTQMPGSGQGRSLLVAAGHLNSSLPAAC